MIAENLIQKYHKPHYYEDSAWEPKYCDSFIVHIPEHIVEQCQSSARLDFFYGKRFSPESKQKRTLHFYIYLLDKNKKVIRASLFYDKSIFDLFSYDYQNTKQDFHTKQVGFDF